MEFMKNTSFGLHHRILNEHGDMAAEAHDIIVNFDFNKKEKTAISDAFRQAASLIEGRLL